jgi:AhpD family alkylhydroperoxidase
MNKDWPQMTRDLSGAIKEVRLGAPEVMKAFSAMASAATSEGTLDTRTKELIALAIAVAIRCDGCVAFHAKAAVEQGPVGRRSWRPWAWRSTWARGRA